MANIEFMKRDEMEKYIKGHIRDILDVYKEKMVNEWYVKYRRIFNAAKSKAEKEQKDTLIIPMLFKFRYGMNTFTCTVKIEWDDEKKMASTSTALMFVKWHEKLYAILGDKVKDVRLFKVTQHFLERFKERSPYKDKVNDSNIFFYLSKEFGTSFGNQPSDVPERIWGVYGLAVADTEHNLLMTYIGNPNVGQWADKFIGVSQTQKTVDEAVIKQNLESSIEKAKAIGVRPNNEDEKPQQVKLDFTPKELPADLKKALLSGNEDKWNFTKEDRTKLIKELYKKDYGKY